MSNWVRTAFLDSDVVLAAAGHAEFEVPNG